MFGLGETKLCVAAPMKGRLMDIAAVPDPVFGEKMLGDGFAVEPASEESAVVAPCDGEIVLVADTKHAVALRAKGVELLIHVGLDTAALCGEGFQALVRAGDQVTAGTPLLTFDRSVLQGKGKSLITVVVVTNATETVKTMAKDLTKPQAVLTVTVK